MFWTRNMSLQPSTHVCEMIYFKICMCMSSRKNCFFTKTPLEMLGLRIKCAWPPLHRGTVGDASQIPHSCPHFAAFNLSTAPHIFFESWHWQSMILSIMMLVSSTVTLSKFQKLKICLFISPMSDVCYPVLTFGPSIGWEQIWQLYLQFLWNKLVSLEATLVLNYDPPTLSLTADGGEV